MRLLDRIERIGNRLPDPVTLFALGTILVIIGSDVLFRSGWQVQKLLPNANLAAEPATLVSARSLLAPDGAWWLIGNLVKNFIEFPPLGIVLVGMLGIGVAERSGFIPAVLTALARAVNAKFLCPTIVLLGILSSLGLDAGYVVLPPIAALLFGIAGRSPLAGIAAAFAGISAGFSANFVITAVDPLLAGFTTASAQFIDPSYQVAVTANWWFMAVSTVLLTLVGWAVSSLWVEPRLATIAVLDGSPSASTTGDRRAMRYALASLVLVALGIAAMVIVPGASLTGLGNRFPRWVEATVPILFVIFFVPGVVYGLLSGNFKNDRDIAAAMGKTLADLGPYIVLAFFAAQFIATFKYSQLGEMLAITGGNTLVALDMPTWGLVLGFLLVVMFGNLLVGSASAKYAFFAPVFVPMLMYVGISPELTQAAYRVGDSITNVVTPLNPYMIIIVALVQRFLPTAGLGTVVALMLPYALAFAVVWIGLLLLWLYLGIPLGPGGPLTYG